MPLCTRAQVCAPSSSCSPAEIFPLHLDFLCISLIHFPRTSRSVHLPVSHPGTGTVAQIIPLFLISVLFLICLHQEKNRPNTTHDMDPGEHSKNLAELVQGTRLEKSGDIKKYKKLATDISANLAAKIKKQPEKFECLWLIWHLPVQVPLDLLKISYKILSFYFKKTQRKSKQKTLCPCTSISQKNNIKSTLKKKKRIREL